MSELLQAYKHIEDRLPEKILTWYLYGAGMENFGRDRKPVQVPLPKYEPDQLLVRVDAVGICFSDIKVINQGDKHPRLIGRDLMKDPVTLGHEPAVTVVGVGEELRGRFEVGQRFIVQADVFYQGKSMAFGYVLPGAQTQYQLLTQELLNGDEGCYLLPIAKSTGYAEAALTEPWACVVASYRITRRLSILPEGILWVIGAPGDDGNYSLNLNIFSRLVIATDVTGSVRDELRMSAENGEFELVETPTFESIAQAEDLRLPAGSLIDDMIVLGADADIVEKTATFLGKHGIMNIVADQPLSRPVRIDVGKIHYQNHSYVGTSTRMVGNGYEPVRLPSELKPEGIAWFIGAGGPMGQMHVQRAIEMKGDPSRVLATDIDTARLKSLRDRFIRLADRRGVDLQVVNPNEMSREEFDRLLRKFTGDLGFDDIVVLAPVASLISEAVPYLADEGLMNIFAGVPIGTIADLDLSGVYLRNVRIVGSSGSKLTDMRDTLDAVESGHLNTNASVAAIGGIDASWDGMLATKEGQFPGKIIIYPQVHLPLTAVSDLKDVLPKVAAKLADGMFWNNDAEEELLSGEWEKEGTGERE
jgi:threonine dehydrogenase-like Zn-dependent dehydrogenase